MSGILPERPRQIHSRSEMQPLVLIPDLPIKPDHPGSRNRQVRS
jgi:hypothetical protein